LCLLKHSPLIRPTIYELRASNAPAEEGNVALAPNALRVLDYVGVYTQVSSQGYNYEDLAFLNGSWEVLGKIWNGSEKEYNFKALRVQRQFVRAALLEACEKRGVQIRYGMRCVGIIEETDTSASARFESGERVTADYVVGADGIHSRIREFVSPNCEPAYSGMMGIGGGINRARLSSATNDIPLPCFVFSDQGGFAMMPTSFDGSKIGFFITIPQKERSREEWAKLSSDKEELSRMLKKHCEGHWPDLIKEIAQTAQPESLSNRPYFTVPTLKTYLSPKHRVILIGDAAHAIPPTGGQGAAMAFEDAQTLAYALARTATPRKLSQRILHKWQTHRQARIEKVHVFTSRGGDLRKEAPSMLEKTIKEWGLWAAFKWWGPTGGLRWLYEYRAENVVGVLAEN